MTINIDDRQFLTLALQVREELSKRSDDALPSAAAFAKEIARLLYNRVENLTTDPEAWTWEAQDRSELCKAAGEEQEILDHEDRLDVAALAA